MDAGDAGSPGSSIPKRLQETTSASLDESVALGKRWDGTERGRLRAAFAPRFAVSCSRALLEAVASLSAPAGRSCTRTHPNRAMKSPSFAGFPEA